MKVFVTIGTQLPFDRLILKAESVCRENQYVASFQIGQSSHKPSYGKVYSHLSQLEYDKLFMESDLIISHAGMGTIISSLEMCKPLVVVPRLQRFGEHRNDHQLATCEKFRNYENISVCLDLESLEDDINRMAKVMLSNSKTKITGPSHAIIKMLDELYFEECKK